MTSPDFLIANLESHRSELFQLNLEYVTWAVSEFKNYFGVSVEDLFGMSISEYVHSVIEKVCGDRPPTGVFYLIRMNSQLAGMGGLRCLRSDVAEIKRIYIRPEFRGLKIGDHMMQRLLEDAKRFGYRRVSLESGPFMKSAHRLYERMGFTDCPIYEGVEVPEMFHDQWRFMDRTL